MIETRNILTRLTAASDNWPGIMTLDEKEEYHRFSSAVFTVVSSKLLAETILFTVQEATKCGVPMCFAPP